MQQGFNPERALIVQLGQISAKWPVGIVMAAKTPNALNFVPPNGLVMAELAFRGDRLVVNFDASTMRLNDYMDLVARWSQRLRPAFYFPGFDKLPGSHKNAIGQMLVDRYAGDDCFFLTQSESAAQALRSFFGARENEANSRARLSADQARDAVILAQRFDIAEGVKWIREKSGGERPSTSFSLAVPGATLTTLQGQTQESIHQLAGSALCLAVKAAAAETLLGSSKRPDSVDGVPCYIVLSKELTL